MGLARQHGVMLRGAPLFAAWANNSVCSVTRFDRSAAALLLTGRRLACIQLGYDRTKFAGRRAGAMLEEVQLYMHVMANACFQSFDYSVSCAGWGIGSAH